MNHIQVRARTFFEIASTNLGDLIAMPDPEAAEALNTRMAALNQIHRLHERSYVERGLVIREFEKRHLWKHLIDPETERPFPHLTAWLSCSDFLGCRRTNFEAKRDMELLQDVPTDKLIDVPKGNLKVLTQLSTAVRNDPGILEAAKTMQPNEFMDKVEKEQPHQHIEARKVMRFSPGRSWAKTVEEAIAWALEHDIAGSRDEALLRMAETSLNEWQLEQEIKEVIGIGNSEESAWQNAAESLPAQPEQVNLCAHGYDVGCFVCNSNPVAPVEATHNPPTEELFDRIAQRKQALVDSSSISSEQTFEEWWGNTGNQIFGADAKDAAFAAWNAAKGQSNGRS